MAAIYTVFTSPYHPPIPDHLPTLVVTPHGQPAHVLYSYLHTDYNRINYLLTPSPQGDLCVAKLFPPRASNGGSSDPGHSSRESRAVRCEASRELKWSIENTGVRSPIYKIINSDDTPLYQISKPNPNADFWTMFYFAYAGHQIPPRRAEFGKIQKNPPEKGGGTRITITGKTEDEKRVWQTLGEGNEDCVEWVVCCAALNLLDDEILKAAGQTGSMRSGPPPGSSGTSIASSSTPSLAQPPPRPGQSAPAPSPRLANARPQNQQLHDPGPVPRPNPSRMDSGSSQQSRHGGQPQQNGSGLRPQEPPRSASAQSGNYQSRPGQQPDPRLDPRAQGGGRPPPQQQQQGGYDPRSGPPPQHQQQQQQGGYDPRYGPPPGQQQHQQQQQQGQQRPPMGQQHSSGRGRF